MKFIDLIKLKIKAGKGGDGIIAFRRELYVPKGGPSGGDGGNGGSVIFVGDQNINTLLELRKTREISAKPGENGKIKNMHGKSAPNVFVKVPLGTIIRNAKNDEIIGDIIKHGQELVIAKGGRGGRGNARFVSSTNRVPKISENGSLGQELEVICELKLLANVGLIGLPNAGKSTFLSVISAAKPLIADYPFTTLVPQLAVVKVHNDSFVVADLPGLIAGASDGKGLGLQFLKHIERCQVLVHMIDIASSDHYLTYQLIVDELKKYNQEILSKPEVIVVNKIDLVSDLKIVEQLKTQIKKPVFAISNFSKENIQPLLEHINDLVQEAKKNNEKTNQEIQEHVVYKYEPKLVPKVEIIINKVQDNKWEVKGETIAKIAQKNPLNTHQNILLFEIKLKDLGVFEQLRKKGIKKGDNVKIFNYDMIWEEE